MCARMYANASKQRKKLSLNITNYILLFGLFFITHLPKRLNTQQKIRTQCVDLSPVCGELNHYYFFLRIEKKGRKKENEMIIIHTACSI